MGEPLMRRILLDQSRPRGAEKRRGAVIQAALEDALTIPVQDQFDLISLDSLEQLAAFDARKCQVAEGHATA